MGARCGKQKPGGNGCGAMILRVQSGPQRVKLLETHMWKALLALAAVLAADPEESFSLTLGGPALIFALPAVNEAAAIDMVRKPVVTLNEITGIKPSYPSNGVVLYFFQRANGADVLKDLNGLARKYRSDKVRMLGICIDDTPPEELRTWIDPLKLDYPILSDNFRIVSERYGVKATPTIVVVDGAGYVYSAGAPAPSEVASTLVEQLGGLLKK